MARKRINVWDPGATETLVWYAKAVAEMKKKPLTEPTSWRYQAAIHEYDRARDPLAVSGEALPPPDEQDSFWNQCQHGSWYFLPWHRMYLHHFEQIVAAEVERLQGPKDWALPYWNYSKDDDSRLLPPAFRKPVLAGGGLNPLFVAERVPATNGGEQFADARDTDVAPSLTEPDFDIPSIGGTSGFGGPVTKFEHGGDVSGTLDVIPHGTMHIAIGGPGSPGKKPGWMSRFYTAALDPIFWIHHANIDRMWEIWLRRDDTHKNPGTADWLTSVSFTFHSSLGNLVTMTPKDVIDSSSLPLSYSYDDTSDPLAATAMLVAERKAMSRGKRPEPEMVGATDRPIDLTDIPAHARFAAPGMASGATAFAAATPRRVFLNVENVSATDAAPAYDVYLNVPGDSDPSQHDELFAGRVPLFGVAEASAAGKKHPGSGLTYALDITELFERVSTQAGWDPDNLRVSFVPVRAPAGTKVRVGRVSLYFG